MSWYIKSAHSIFGIGMFSLRNGREARDEDMVQTSHIIIVKYAGMTQWR